jgi:Protein of unknown function (DUF4242)
MAEREAASFVAECFWPGVRDADLRALDARVEAEISVLDGEGGRVRYLGSLLMREDQVVLCLFQGPAAAVQAVAERAGVPFERILESAQSPWPAVESD